MRAQTLPAVAGWRWMMEGFALYRRGPMQLSMLVMAYWFTLLLLNIIPVIGTLAASLIMPGLAVGLMQAARNLERQQPVSLPTLFGGLRENTRTLVALGALYLSCTLVILAIASVFDGGELFRFMMAGKPEAAEQVEEASLLPALIVLTLLVPVLMAYWFAPVLAGWHKLTLSKSLFFSFMACAMNWRPFLAYSVALLVYAAILPGVVIGGLLLIFPALQGAASLLVVMLMGTVVAPAVFASFYISYRDIFGISEIV
jgi:hypothetical protein